jgi:hypothetical protein
VSNSFTCDCGHIKRVHVNEITRTWLCTDCYITKDKVDSSCYYPWHTFKPNNLKHLERLSK